jgi:TM2 domain-containing membrane protein YozV
LCALLLPGLGLHKFILGYSGEGLIYLLGNIFSFIGGFFSCGILWLASGVLWVMSVTEGIIYLTKSDAEFDQTYVYGRKPWF